MPSPREPLTPSCERIRAVSEPNDVYYSRVQVGAHPMLRAGIWLTLRMSCGVSYFGDPRPGLAQAVASKFGPANVPIGHWPGAGHRGARAGAEDEASR